VAEVILTPGPDDYRNPGGRADSILGLGGNDTINGEDQNDTILGGDDNDRLDGGSQDDRVFGEAGNDTITNVASGNDLLDGGAGEDSITGGSGNETILGGSENDRIFSGGGNDSVDGGEGNDIIDGGGFGVSTLIGGGGDDSIFSGGGERAIFGGSGNDTFSGFSNDGQVRFISGGGGDERAIINGTFAPGALSLVPGNVVVGGTSYAYQASYVTDTGYRIYFENFIGDLQFDDTLVDVNAPCFAEGTMIATPEGERAVETLRAGDLVVTAAGQGAAIKPVRWVGRREVNLDAHPRPQDAAPILVLPGALGAGAPHRPLRVSPDHALLVDGVLVPAGLLVDGETILRLPARGRVTWYHVELDAHDLLVTEGALTESYLDMGNRHAFANAGTLTMLHVDFAPGGATATGCRPRVTCGAALDRVRMARAGRRLRAAG
jgi:hypothetical protein